MTEHQPDEDTRAKLSELDEEIASLRGERDGVRDQTGGDDVQDAEDTAAALTNLEEQDALLATLEQRRESLLGRQE